MERSVVKTLNCSSISLLDKRAKWSSRLRSRLHRENEYGSLNGKSILESNLIGRVFEVILFDGALYWLPDLLHFEF